jgi:HK97 family phage major capsid protein
MTWEDCILTAEEVATIVTVPEALIDDANFDIFGEVRPRLAEAFGALIDAAVFFGEGSPASFPVGGIVGHASGAANGIAEGAVSGQDVAGDISQVMGKIEDDGFVVGGFAARQGIKAKLRGLRTTTNELLFQPSFEVGTPPTIYGENIMYARNGGWDATVAELVAGDWQYAVVGVRQDITFKVLTEATFTDGSGAVVTSLAETDQVALRCVMRIGFAIANPVTRLQPTAAQRSPFAVLTPHA